MIDEWAVNYRHTLFTCTGKVPTLLLNLPTWFLMKICWCSWICSFIWPLFGYCLFVFSLSFGASRRLCFVNGEFPCIQSQIWSRQPSKKKMSWHFIPYWNWAAMTQGRNNPPTEAGAMPQPPLTYWNWPKRPGQHDLGPKQPGTELNIHYNTVAGARSTRHIANLAHNQLGT